MAAEAETHLNLFVLNGSAVSVSDGHFSPNFNSLGVDGDVYSVQQASSDYIYILGTDATGNFFAKYQKSDGPGGEDVDQLWRIHGVDSDSYIGFCDEQSPVLSGNGAVTRYDEEDGSEVWTADPGGSVFGVSTLSSRNISIAIDGANTQIREFGHASGDIVNEIDTTGAPTSVTRDDDDQYVVYHSDGALRKYDRDGEILWTNDSAVTDSDTVWRDHNEHYYLGSGDTFGGSLAIVGNDGNTLERETFPFSNGASSDAMPKLVNGDIRVIYISDSPDIVSRDSNLNEDWSGDMGANGTPSDSRAMSTHPRFSSFPNTWGVEEEPPEPPSVVESLKASPVPSQSTPSEPFVTTFSQIESSQEYGQYDAEDGSIEMDSAGRLYKSLGFLIEQVDPESDSEFEWDQFISADDISLGEDGYLYAVEDDGTVEKLDAETGDSELWNTGTMPGAAPYRTVADDEGGAYVLGSADWNTEITFARVNPDDPDSGDGGTLWGVEELGEPDGDYVSAPIRTNGSQDVTLVFDDEIRRYDGVNGSLIESQSLPSGHEGRRFIVNDDSETIYFVLNSGFSGGTRIGAFTWDGGIQWDIETSLQASAIDVDGDGVLHVPSADTGDVHEYDTTDGSYFGTGTPTGQRDELAFTTFPSFPHQPDGWTSDMLDMVGATIVPPTSTTSTLEPTLNVGQLLAALQTPVSGALASPTSTASSTPSARVSTMGAQSTLPRPSIRVGMDAIPAKNSGTIPSAVSQGSVSADVTTASPGTHSLSSTSSTAMGANTHSKSPSTIATHSTSTATPSVDSDVGGIVTPHVPVSAGIKTVQSYTTNVVGSLLDPVGFTQTNAISGRTPLALSLPEISTLRRTPVGAVQATAIHGTTQVSATAGAQLDPLDLATIETLSHSPGVSALASTVGSGVTSNVILKLPFVGEEVAAVVGPAVIDGAPMTTGVETLAMGSGYLTSTSTGSPDTSATTQVNTTIDSVGVNGAPSDIEGVSGVDTTSNTVLATHSLSTIIEIEPRFETPGAVSNSAEFRVYQNKMDVTTKQGDK